MFRRKGYENEDVNGQNGALALDGEETGAKRAPAGARGTSVSFHPDVPNRSADSAERTKADAPTRADPDSKRLTVGREISLNGGEITDCERLVVEGNVEATMNGGRLLEIAKGGLFKGSVTIDNADIAGTFEGELRVNNRLTIQASGRIHGTIRYGQLEIVRGGRIDGSAEYDGAGRDADLQAVDVAAATPNPEQAGNPGTE